jgi:uncharacterized protein
MTKILKTLFAALFVAASLAAFPAAADPLDDARSAGLVGERPDGYVALVDPSAPGDVQALVKSINAQRRAYYQQIADEEGVPVEQIGAITAEKLINESLQPGWYYMDPSGQWQQR